MVIKMLPEIKERVTLIIRKESGSSQNSERDQSSDHKEPNYIPSLFSEKWEAAKLFR